MEKDDMTFTKRRADPKFIRGASARIAAWMLGAGSSVGVLQQLTATPAAVSLRDIFSTDPVTYDRHSGGGTKTERHTGAGPGGMHRHYKRVRAAGRR